jgi:tetratricopeptide (TPR) repeat protein
MSDQVFSKGVYDAQAVSIIQSVIAGTISPLEGVSRLAAHWFPVEGLRGNESLPLLLQTRDDNLNQLDRAVIDLINQDKQVEARRLAEMNWMLAKRMGDEDLMVQCAASLAQTMTGDPTATAERLALLEYAVPKVLEWDRPPSVKAGILAYLADAHFAEPAPSPERRWAAIQACKQAIAFSAPLDDFWYGHLNFIAGTEYNFIGGSVEILQSSIDHFRVALNFYRPDNFPDSYASTLNNLGNSYRDLGQLTANRHLIEEAIACYDKAMPFRSSARSKQVTLSNKSEAQSILNQLGQAGPGQSTSARQEETKQQSQIRDLVRVGDNAFFASQSAQESERERYRKAAADKYVRAMKALGMQGAPAQRAEILHRLAGLYINSTDDDELWTALCLANATQRLSKGSWKPVSQARVSFHRGQMLLKIGFPDLTQYLRLAEALLRDALPTLQQFGQPGEFEQASHYLNACDSLLAATGDKEAKRRAAAMNSEAEMKRLETEVNATQRDGLKRTYQSYLSIVKRVAESELVILLGHLSLESFQAATNQLYDGFNQARELIEVAAKHRDVGDIGGALSVIQRAEERAEEARYSAPSIWCEIAEFYISLPLREDAERCLEKAEGLMNFAIKTDEQTMTGDERRWWIPEYGLEDYLEEIDRTKKTIANASNEPLFDASKTAQLLFPDDQTLRAQAQEQIKYEILQNGLDRYCNNKLSE